ncbi:hypothetical protein CCP1ISM_140006 [Azospirillaceae bacterium]
MMATKRKSTVNPPSAIEVKAPLVIEDGEGIINAFEEILLRIANIEDKMQLINEKIENENIQFSEEVRGVHDRIYEIGREVTYRIDSFGLKLKQSS